MWRISRHESGALRASGRHVRVVATGAVDQVHSTVGIGAERRALADERGPAGRMNLGVGRARTERPRDPRVLHAVGPARLQGVLGRSATALDRVADAVLDREHKRLPLRGPAWRRVPELDDEGAWIR